LPQRCYCDAVVVVVFKLTCAVYRRSIRKMCRVRKKSYYYRRTAHKMFVFGVCRIIQQENCSLSIWMSTKIRKPVRPANTDRDHAKTCTQRVQLYPPLFLVKNKNSILASTKCGYNSILHFSSCEILILSSVQRLKRAHKYSALFG